MKIEKMREMTDGELGDRRRELRKERFHLKLQQQAGQLEKPSELRGVRREVARIETVLSERENRRAKEATK
jgi:large subunit ribosomal protein L29